MAQSVLYGILETLRDTIAALNLPGISGSNIAICSVPSVEIQRFTSEMCPAVVISPYGGETVAASSNLRDDITYRVLVCLVDSLKRDNEQPGDKQTLALDQRLAWRETIRKAVSNQRLTTTVGMTVTVTPGAVVEPAFYRLSLWVSGFTLAITNRETRT